LIEHGDEKGFVVRLDIFGPVLQRFGHFCLNDPCEYEKDQGQRASRELVFLACGRTTLLMLQDGQEWHVNSSSLGKLVHVCCVFAVKDLPTTIYQQQKVETTTRQASPVFLSMIQNI
jgi:hypothetical protein